MKMLTEKRLRDRSNQVLCLSIILPYVSTIAQKFVLSKLGTLWEIYSDLKVRTVWELVTFIKPPLLRLG